MLRDAALLYDQVGIRDVTLDAVEVGRYVWAMCGFDFAVEADRVGVLSAVEDFAAALGLPLHDLQDVQHSWEIGYMEPRRPLMMREVVEARGIYLEEADIDADTLNQAILPGKALLLYSDFDGYEARLDLTAASPGRDQMMDYTDL